jgi:nicotinamidase/pyrazinamidase
MKRALLLIDIQNDFIPGGSLAVPEGDQVVAVANHWINQATTVIATQDWHPANHGSFAAHHAGATPGQLITLEGLQQILWPVHCVQGTPGAEFHPSLNTGRFTKVFTKGTDPLIDSYSGFFDNGQRRSTGLGDWLRGEGITALDVMGLATDYCVRFSVLDALRLGFAVRVIASGCRAVDLTPGDGARALDAMAAAGATVER